MQPFEYRSVRSWSKEIDGTRTGGRKRIFFNSRPRAPHGLWRPRQWNPVDSWRGGLPGVALGRLWSRASAYTAHATAYSIFWPILSADRGALASLGQVWVPRPLDCCIDGVSGAGAYPLPDLPREASRSRSTPEKSVQFGPDGAPFPAKTSITRGPPVVAVAVSLDPIQPQR